MTGMKIKLQKKRTLNRGRPPEPYLGWKNLAQFSAVHFTKRVNSKVKCLKKKLN